MATEGGASTSKTKVPKRSWNPREDAALVMALQELCLTGHWKTDNGFRPGYLHQLEKMIDAKIPGCGLLASPHIDSRYKHLKKQTNAITEMLEKGSGFAWDHDQCMIVCEQHVYDGWVKSHSGAAGLRLKPFPHYRALADIFGKDRAQGDAAESAFDAAVDIERHGGTPLENLEEVEETQENEIGSEFSTQVPSSYVGDGVSTGPSPRTHASGSRAQTSSEGIDASLGNGPSPQGSRRKKRVRDPSVDESISNTLIQLVEDNKQFNQATSNALKVIANSMSNEKNQKEALVSEMARLGFPRLQYLLNAAKWVMSDSDRLYIFFSLPDPQRIDYLESFFVSGTPPPE